MYNKHINMTYYNIYYINISIIHIIIYINTYKPLFIKNLFWYMKSNISFYFMLSSKQLKEKCTNNMIIDFIHNIYLHKTQLKCHHIKSYSLFLLNVKTGVRWENTLDIRVEKNINYNIIYIKFIISNIIP